jgi:hypothetical protein
LVSFRLVYFDAKSRGENGTIDVSFRIAAKRGISYTADGKLLEPAKHGCYYR